jgi:hypothetical protein
MKLKTDTIVSIKKLDNRKTIDIRVGGDHLFFANDILTHNCGYDNTDIGLADSGEGMGPAMDADVVFTLWQTNTDKEVGIIRSTCKKNRLGGMIDTEIEYEINYESLRVLNRVQHEDAKPSQQKLLEDIDEL